jgi:hypothetical protein
MTLNGIEVPDARIAEYCREWQVVELSLFGSVLRPDFRPDSDVDVLVSFSPEAHWSLYDIVEMMDELKEILRREVDLVEKEALRNPFRRREILATRKVIYAA